MTLPKLTKALAKTETIEREMIELEELLDDIPELSISLGDVTERFLVFGVWMKAAVTKKEHEENEKAKKEALQ
jgi:hypothetical protein